MDRSGRAFAAHEQAAVSRTILEAYRYQYIFSGVQRTRFPEILRGMIGDTQFGRVTGALSALG
jgi:hypothetical protein